MSLMPDACDIIFRDCAPCVKRKILTVYNKNFDQQRREERAAGFWATCAVSQFPRDKHACLARDI
ncbi:hypothetical protein [Noviherbaspirillum denitrificans]|uniref:Uncharacterized protein n=1 Tax=Noviherbaspirillum denitrificans TaxID=1968433 RepID=A0A254TH21_9BURK|nr:hypothetical protein [Noviherbaspirillum denitrificans]OWW20602.1 hypothetical protein AYR66_15015 [Noviherbaspirillum denitrificans]